MSEKYSAFAPFYDALSGEYPVYRRGRVLGIKGLWLSDGDQVLDVGCGTGLNFPLLQKGIGSSGIIVGIDRSQEMLRQARARAARHGWNNVILLEADAVHLSPEQISPRIESLGGRGLSDAVLATYALSLMPSGQQVWENMVALCQPNATASVVDMQDPQGLAAVFTPLARLACWLGGADIQAHPWAAVERDCADVVAASARGGHLQIRSGRLPG